MKDTTDLLPVRYERSTFEIVTVRPVRSEHRSNIAGAILLIGGLVALGIALAHIGSATDEQAVAWAFVVAAVIAALDRWA